MGFRSSQSSNLTFQRPGGQPRRVRNESSLPHKTLQISAYYLLSEECNDDGKNKNQTHILNEVLREKATHIQTTNHFCARQCSRAMVLKQGWFCPHGHLATSCRHFWMSQLGEGCNWPLAGRGQICCWTSCHAQDSPTTKNYPGHNVNSARLRNSVLGPNSQQGRDRNPRSLRACSLVWRNM